MKETKRGIPTNTSRKNERKPKTITNRLGQLSMSLPRIDDKKRWSGFAGLAGSARQIAELIPDCKYLIEPFAGSAKVYQMAKKRLDLKIGLPILNDTAPFVVTWLKKNFPEARVTNMDFIDCVEQFDSKDSVFLFDAPWYVSYYDQPFASFNRKSISEYDNQVLSLCSNMQGKFIIASRKENNRYLQTKYNHKLITSEYVLSGHYPKVLITTNLDDWT